jgi:hypothetical protein
MAFLRLLKVTGYLKTFIKIMVSLKFHDVSFKEDYIELDVMIDLEQLAISISKGNDKNDDYVIFLDRQTAIKLSKELRKQIARIPF